MNEPAADNLEAPPGETHRNSRGVTDIITHAIISVDEAGTILSVNPATETIFGYSTTELLGNSLSTLLPGSAQVGEATGVHRNGREIPLVVSRGEFTENGRRVFTLIACDLTERRRIERRLDAQLQVARILAESETITDAAPALLQAIAESVGWDLGVLWTLDQEAEELRCLSFWRSPTHAVDGFEAASRALTLGCGIGLPGRIWQSRAADWINDLATDTGFTRGLAANRAGLTSAFGFPIMVDPNVSGVMEFFSREPQVRDQSLLSIMTIIGQQIGHFVERRRAEAERSQIFDREQRARHEVEAAFDRMKQVQIVTDVALSHLAMDELLAELLSRVRDAMNVDTVAILLLETDGDHLVAWAAKGLEQEVEMGVRIPVGSGFAGRVAATKSPIVIDDLEKGEVLNPLLRETGIRSLLGVPLLVEGRVIGVIHTGKFERYHFTEDDTRLLQLVADRIALAIDNARLFEEERVARREAEAASRTKDEFLTTISHELRTPLTPIIGWVHMIRNGILPDKETSHGLSVIEKNSYALKHLINDLLDMSAILSGKMRMEELPVPVEQVVNEAVETVRPLAVARNIALAVNFHDWQNDLVSGDRARLVQVFSNLLNNAVKFSDSKGRVDIDVHGGEGEVTVRIRDIGMGIAPEFLPFVFERFRQADGSKTRAHGGLGLGLALVKSFVEAHRGSVSAESEGLGQGSRFTVRLPRLVTQTKPDQSAKQSVVEALPEKIHLLIVDDDPDTLEMLSATMEARGFRVTARESATETLALQIGTPVDLIISDIGMPGMDGFNLIQKLREKPEYQNVPAIALSGYASRKDAKSAIAAGFDAHVSKPVDPAELVIMVNGLVNRNSGGDR